MKKIITIALFALIAIATEARIVKNDELIGKVFGELQAVSIQVNEQEKTCETINVYQCLHFIDNQNCIMYYATLSNDGSIVPVQGCYCGTYECKDGMIAFKLVWNGYDSENVKSMIYLQPNDDGNLEGVYIEPIGNDRYCRSQIVLEKFERDAIH